MSDNLNNQFNSALFEKELIVTTTGGDITASIIQPSQATNLEYQNLDQRDSIDVVLYSVLGTITAGAVLEAKYYKRMSRLTSASAVATDKLLSTETKTLAEITVGNHLTTGFSGADIPIADYFTLSLVLKEAVGADYTVTGTVIVKKKSDLETDFRLSGIENGILFVDGNRIDAYVEDGSILFPFKTIQALITALNTDYAALSNKQLSTYNITVAKGSYSLTGLVIPTYKLLRFHGTGVIFTGNFAITQSPIGGSGEDPYTRIEFVGNSGFRGEKGQSFQISGNVTCTRTNDSLTYLAFIGCRISGNWLFDSDGTWVLQADHNRFSGTISSGTFTDPESAVLIESDAFSRFSGAINIKGCLYRCNNTEFSANVTCDSNFSAMDANASYMPYRITNCVFSNTANSFIGNQNILIDSISYKSLLATTETITFTGAGGLVITDPANSIQVGTPVNAVAATLDITVGAVPADYVANVQSYGAFTAGATNAEDGQKVTFDDQVYTFKTTPVDVTYDVTIGADIASSIINVISKANSNVASKVDIVRTGNNFVATFKTTAYLGALGNTKVFSTDVAGASVDGNFANGVTEVLKKTTLNGIEYIYYDSAAGDDPTVDYPACVKVDTKATQILTALELATQIATDTDMSGAVAVGAVVTATWGVKGVIGNAVAFADGTGGNVTAAATMSGGVNGTPGLKGMVYYDETLGKVWHCLTDNYTITQSSWIDSSLGSIILPATAFKGGTTSAYTLLTLAGYPYLVRKFLNATTNTAYFDIDLPQISATSTMRFRFRYSIDAATEPASTETSIFTIGGAAITKAYDGTETKDDIITTAWTTTTAQSRTGLLTVTGTYAQLISIIDVEIEYTKA